MIYNVFRKAFKLMIETTCCDHLDSLKSTVSFSDNNFASHIHFTNSRHSVFMCSFQLQH